MARKPKTPASKDASSDSQETPSVVPFRSPETPPAPRGWHGQDWCDVCLHMGDLKNGDLLSFSGVSLFSKAIQLWTRKPVSHVGLVCRIKDPINRLFVMESIEGRGVRLVPIEAWFRWNGKIQHYRLKPSANLIRSEIMSAAFSQCEFAYATPHQLLRSFGVVLGPLLRLFGDPADTDPTRVHCAEFVVESLKGAGARFEKEPAAFSPGEVTELRDIYDFGVTLH